MLLVVAARADRECEAVEIEGPAGVHIDLAGEAGFDLIRRAGLEDVDLAHEVGGDVPQLQLAAVGGEHTAAIPGGFDVGEPADRDDVGLAAAAVRDLHARDALQRLDHVVVRQLADVFGDDRFQDLRGLFLVLQSFPERLANAGDDDGICLLGRTLLGYRTD